MTFCILNSFCSIVKSVVSLISQGLCIELFGVCIEFLKTFKEKHKHQIISFSKNLQSEKQGEHCNNLLLLIEMLTHMITRDFIHFSSSSNQVIDNEQNSQKQIVIGVFVGIEHLFPLINIELLSFDKLRKQYFKLIGFMVEMYPEKVIELPNYLFSQFIQSVLFGMKHYDFEIAQESFEAVYSFCIHLFQLKLEKNLNFDQIVIIENERELSNQIIQPKQTKVIDLLLSKERIIHLLYYSIFNNKYTTHHEEITEDGNSTSYLDHYSMNKNKMKENDKNEASKHHHQIITKLFSKPMKNQNNLLDQD
jgi:hypothetical protein